MGEGSFHHGESGLGSAGTLSLQSKTAALSGEGGCSRFDLHKLYHCLGSLFLPVLFQHINNALGALQGMEAGDFFQMLLPSVLHLIIAVEQPFHPPVNHLQ